MLNNTFVHIQGIGPKTERSIWDRGIKTWSDFLMNEDVIFSPPKDDRIRNDLTVSMAHWNDVQFFVERLSSAHTWRLYESFKEKAVFLDIETSGGYQGIDEITVIGIYDGTTVHTFINGINLHEFEVAIAHYDLVVTFNGSQFDLPRIRGWFPHITLPSAHIDLRFLLNKIGYRGGLKKIEKTLGFCRDSAIDGMDGYDAVMLWKAFKWGDSHQALEQLIAYNRADIVNLKPLMEFGYNEMRERTYSCHESGNGQI